MIVDVKQLTKKFDRKKGESFTAVGGIDFSIGPGERVAFIGPNGAGKSTTLKMLTGILYPSGGQATVAGFTPWEQRQKLAYQIGIVFGQRSQLWYHLPVRDSFELIGKIYDVPDIDYKKRLAHIVDVLQIGAGTDSDATDPALSLVFNAVDDGREHAAKRLSNIRIQNRNASRIVVCHSPRQGQRKKHQANGQRSQRTQ
mgnify:CR=1 FL=1